MTVFLVLMQWTAPIQRHRNEGSWLQGDYVGGLVARLLTPKKADNQDSCCGAQ